MGFKCSAPGCRTGYRKVTGSVSMYRFPYDPGILKQWLEKIGLPNFVPTANSRLCSLHFQDSDFLTEDDYSNISPKEKIVRPIKSGAIPSIFPNVPTRPGISSAYHRLLLSNVDERPSVGARLSKSLIPATNAPMTRAAANRSVVNSDVPCSTPLPNICPPPALSNYQHIPAIPSDVSNHLQAMQLSANVVENPTMNSVSVQKPPTNAANLPIHPDVRLSPNPYYEQQENGELMRIQTLVNRKQPLVSSKDYEVTFPFRLSVQQANLISANRVRSNEQTDFGIRVIVRFCKCETSTVQDDALPIYLSLKCNDTRVPLGEFIPSNQPGMDGRRLGRPINITPQVLVSPTVPNLITVKWRFDSKHPLRGQIYAVGVYLVKQLSPKDLLNKLNEKGEKPAEFAKSMIKEKMTSLDAEIITNKLQTSLRCPLGKMRIETPLRTQKCTHLQCFDAYCYLAMNERRPKWRCPCCNKPVTFWDLYIDGFFKEILNNCDSLVSKVEFDEDGSWTRVREDKEEGDPSNRPPIPPPEPHQVFQLDQPQCVGDDRNGGDASVIDLTGDSDEEIAAENQPGSGKRRVDSSDAGNTKPKRVFVSRPTSDV